MMSSRKATWAAVVFVATVLAVAAHAWATSVRGYEAIGGEILIPALPTLAAMVDIGSRL